MTEHVWLTAAEVADRLRISKQTVYRWAKTGQLPAYRPGGRWCALRFRATDIDNALKERA